MNRDESEGFARDWVAAWNDSDLDTLMAHYADEVTFISPRAATVTGSAVVKGKAALRAYWSAAMQRAASRHFTLERVIWDEEPAELVIVYVNAVDGVQQRACEIMRFAADGVVVGEAMYGARG